MDDVELRETFDFYDTDSNGVIDLEEFGGLCGALSGSFSHDEIVIGFAEIDTDRNGVIDFDEFADWWQSR